MKKSRFFHFFSFGDLKNVSFREACAVIKYIFFKKYKNIFSVNCLHKWPSDVKIKQKKRENVCFITASN